MAAVEKKGPARVGGFKSGGLYLFYTSVHLGDIMSLDISFCMLLELTDKTFSTDME